MFGGEGVEEGGFADIRSTQKSDLGDFIGGQFMIEYFGGNVFECRGLE